MPALTTIALCGGVKSIHENYTVLVVLTLSNLSQPFSVRLLLDFQELFLGIAKSRLVNGV